MKMQKQNDYNQADLEYLRKELSGFGDLIEVRDREETISASAGSFAYVLVKIAGYSKETHDILNVYMTTATDALAIKNYDWDTGGNITIGLDIIKELTGFDATFKIVLMKRV